LLSFFSTDPPNKKKRFEDKALEGVVLEHELELNATTKHIAPIYEIQRPGCSSSSTSQLEIGLINKRDSAHGPIYIYIIYIYIIYILYIYTIYIIYSVFWRRLISTMGF
jgi:hypothetical protein